VTAPGANRPASGRLFGVGVGPGDPELVTVKAKRAIEAADVVAYPTARRSGGVARRTADPYLSEDQIEVPLTFPVTTEETDHPGGYEAALREFYDEAAEELAAHLDAGRDVAVLCGGDPFFYGSYMYLHERLAHRYPTEVIPGVTSFSAATAAAGAPLVRRDETFTALPGTLSEPELERALAEADAAVVLKLGGHFDSVRAAAGRAGVAERSIYVERASGAEERVAPLADVDGPTPYMSLLLVPSAAEGQREQDRGRGSVAVIGLGPAGPDWLTPEARAELAAAEDLVGYAPYLERVPRRAGQRRHASDNRVEAERARHALELAAGGARVAVVSSGDPGIFAMATAVLEAVDEEHGRFGAIELRVVPGVSAMQVAAARVGAPLGHDFCAISLSDRLKPWSAIERRLDAAGAADFALALYNPASRSRRQQLEQAREILLRHRAAATPVVVARALGAEEESVTVSTLGEFDAEAVDMRTLLIVGSSTTRAFDSGNGRPRVFTPRRYP
jgi:precorrin-2 C20-methyltransferase/precorrin-3B C17-methyltransferase